MMNTDASQQTLCSEGQPVSSPNTSRKAAVSPEQPAAAIKSMKAQDGSRESPATATPAAEPETLTRDNAAPGLAVTYRGKRRLVDEVSGPGVYLKAARRGGKRDYLYFYECAQFGVRIVREGEQS